MSPIDLSAYLGIIVFIGFIIWLSNREMRSALGKTRESEKLLQSERDLLEKQVKKRTEELLVTEKERLFELKRTAQFGELSQGLFHDLMNPLSSLALYMERLEKSKDYSNKDNQEIMNRVITASQRMSSFMDNVKKCLGDQSSSPRKNAILHEELWTVRDVLAYKARMAGVEIKIDAEENISVPTHPVRVYQLFLNLITNAIDACVGRENSLVEISVKRKGGMAEIKVKDNGRGMTQAELDRCFKQSFSTHTDGTGIGLLTVHSIVNDDLHGSIRVESVYGKGSEFIIQFPA